MTDEALRDLVVKHETSISSLLLLSERLQQNIKKKERQNAIQQF